MTHNTDCTIKDEFRDELTEIARMMWEGDEAAAKERLTAELGWEHIGGGAGRSVFRVGHTHQSGERETATHEVPCVVKIATSGHHYNGRMQNSGEVGQFQRLPDELAEGDDPIFVPVKDWHDGDLWLSMPEVDPTGGVAHEVERRLRQAGWECADMHMDNVGEMHGYSVVLDYGLDCAEVAQPDELVDDVERGLKQKGCENIETHDEDDGFGEERQEVTFTTPPELLDIPPVDKESRVAVGVGTVDSVSLIFGSYPHDEAEMVLEGEIPEGMDLLSVPEAAERVAEEWGQAWREFTPPEYRLIPDKGTTSVRLSAELESMAEMPPFAAMDMIEEVFELVEMHFPGGFDKPALDDEIEFHEGFRPKVGMVLNHPGFDNDVVITDVRNGDTIVSDEKGRKYNLGIPGYADVEPGMVTGRAERDIRGITKTIESAIEDALPTTDDD